MWAGFPLPADDASLAAYLIFAGMLPENKAWKV